MGDNQLQLVTFEQAKRLKVLGFNLEADYCFRSYDEGLGLLNKEKFSADWNDGDLYVSLPTVALALKWCRDVKGVLYEIIAFPLSKKWGAGLVVSEVGKGDIDVGQFDTYEQAESALLDVVLDVLTKKGDKA